MSHSRAFLPYTSLPERPPKVLNNAGLDSSGSNPDWKAGPLRQRIVTTGILSTLSLTAPATRSFLPFFSGRQSCPLTTQRGSRTAPIQPSTLPCIRRDHLRAGNLRCGRTPVELARSNERAPQGRGPHARRSRETRCRTGPGSAEDSGDVLD